MLKVSFDFDHTLSTLPMQELAYSLLQAGVDVYVCTARYSDANKGLVKWDNSDLFAVTDHLGIPRSNIIFTGYLGKTQYLTEIGATMHLDDDYLTIRDLNKKSSVVGVHYLNPNWSDKVTKILQEHDKFITIRGKNEDNAGIKSIV